MSSTPFGQTVVDTLCLGEEKAQCLVLGAGSEPVSLDGTVYEGHTIDDRSRARLPLAASRSTPFAYGTHSFAPLLPTHSAACPIPESIERSNQASQTAHGHQCKDPSLIPGVHRTRFFLG